MHRLDPQSWQRSGRCRRWVGQNARNCCSRSNRRENALGGRRPPCTFERRWRWRKPLFILRRDAGRRYLPHHAKFAVPGNSTLGNTLDSFDAIPSTTRNFSIPPEPAAWFEWLPICLSEWQCSTLASSCVPCIANETGVLAPASPTRQSVVFGWTCAEYECTEKYQSRRGSEKGGLIYYVLLCCFVFWNRYI
jgi:hypothetical protein